MCVFLFLLDGWRIGAPILHGCKFFSEEIKKRDTRKKTFGSFHASSAAQRFFFHHMLIVVAPPPSFATENITTRTAVPHWSHAQGCQEPVTDLKRLPNPGSHRNFWVMGIAQT
jgi:hypothetical protein